MNTDIAIIGNGCAALSAVEAIRQSGYRGGIDIFSDSVWQPYNPMLTTYYLSGKIPFEQLFPASEYSAFFEKNEAGVHLNSRVIALNAQEKTLTDASNRIVRFSQCLIASGASPFVPPMEGADAPNVFTMRTAEDALRVKRYVETHEIRSALVVGASMVGIKVCEYFAHNGVDCCLADGADRIFPLSTHPNCAALLEEIVKNNGVRLRFNGAISKILHERDNSYAYFSNSDTPECADIVILSIGVRPNLSFVDRTQLEVDRGIIIDKGMRTSQKGIFAAGDCTQGYDVDLKANRIVGLLQNARMQGRTAGRNLAGGNDTYCGSTPHNITYFMDTDFIGIGDPGAEGEVFERTLTGGRYIRIVRESGRILCVNLINMKEISGVLKNLFFKMLDVDVGDNRAAFDYEEFVDCLITKYMYR